jgi:hypothetical protein
MPVAQSPAHYVNSSKGCPSITESFPLFCILLHKMSLSPLSRHCQWRFAIVKFLKTTFDVVFLKINKWCYLCEQQLFYCGCPVFRFFVGRGEEERASVGAAVDDGSVANHCNEEIENSNFPPLSQWSKDAKLFGWNESGCYSTIYKNEDGNG